jgi:hypothetical protein
MSTWLAGLLALAAITVTYFTCLRPHLRQRGGEANPGPEPDAALDRQVADLREELRGLRAQDYVDSGTAPRSAPPPATET